MSHSAPRFVLGVFAGLMWATMGLAQTRVASPDGNVVIDFHVQEGGRPAYSVTYKEKPVLLESRLGFQPDFVGGFELAHAGISSHAMQWTQLYGERKVVPDNYGQLEVDLQHSSGRIVRVSFRAYNEGAALRFTFPGQADARALQFTGEQTEFHFPPGTVGYEEHGTEGEYRRSKIADIQPWCERPLTLEYASGLYACVAEADNERYPRMLLSRAADEPDTLVTALGGTSSNLASRQPPTTNESMATLALGASTPWRLILIGEKPGDLLEHNYLLLNLCPPLALTDASWIKPGKVMRDTAETTENSKAIIDFAARGGLQYVLIDARWYGTEDPELGDATKVGRPDLNIEQIVQYGQAKNVGLIVYVDRRQLKKQRDVLFPLYEKWGIKGVKLGFVDVGPQVETAWITETIQKAAEHHLMLNIHDGYRPTGYSRTYPNLMTVEGVRGNEHHPTADHNCVLPFTRFVAGPADYTICYMDRRDQTTHGHQLALSVIYYSPLTMLYWYDRPSQYADEPELEFFRHVPTVWDESHVVDGSIGQYAVVARRSGDDWFVGAITNSKPRQIKVALSFLDASKKYVAHMYADSESAPTATHVGVQTRTVDAHTVLDTMLSATGGEAIWLSAEPK